MSIIKVILIAVLTTVIIYELCMTVIADINLYRLSHGKVKVVSSLREYITYSRRMVKWI